MNVVLGYLAVTGGVSSGLMVARGVVRGMTRLIEGQPRAAVGEVIAGAVAPVAGVVNQGGKLSAEVFLAAVAIAGCGEEEAPGLSAPRRQFEPAAADGVPG